MEKQIKELFSKQQDFLARLEVLSENINNLFFLVKELQREINLLKRKDRV